MRKLLLVLLIPSLLNATLTSINGCAWMPERRSVGGDGGAVPTFQTCILDASADECAVIFQVPVSGTLTGCGFRTGTVTVADSLECGYYTVDGSGDATGTAYGGMAVGTVAEGSVTATTAFTVSLGTNATATAGDFVAMKVKISSFVDGNLQITLGLTNGTTRQMFPYRELLNGGSWTKSNDTPVFWVQYSGGVYNYIPGSAPFSAVGQKQFHLGTASQDEWGLSFQVAVPSRLAGVAWAGYVEVGGTYKIQIYSGTTVLDTITVDDDAKSEQFRYSAQSFKFPNPQTLSAATTYRVALQPQDNSATTEILLPFVTVSTAAILDQFYSQKFVLASRVDAGSWDADTTTSVPYISLCFDQFDSGGGTGGGSFTFVGP